MELSLSNPILQQTKGSLSIFPGQECEKIEIYNTKSFAEFIPKESFLDHNLHVSWFTKVPSLITSLGLFFTFLFIVFGLLHLKVQDSGKVDGINETVPDFDNLTFQVRDDAARCLVIALG